MISFEKGMYLRTKDGKIAKFIKYDEEDKEQLITDYYQYSTIWVGDITSYSFNIVDLIQVGDYINGYCVTEIFGNNRKKNPSTLIYCGYEIDNRFYYIGFYNEQIETIITKEQILQMQYKISLEG